MSRTTLKLLYAMVVMTLLLTSVSASDKKRDWREGVWRSSDRITLSVAGRAVTLEEFSIETSDYEYAVQIRLGRGGKRLPMTVNTRVRFAIDKEVVYVISEDVKEDALTLTKKTLRQTR